MSAPRSSESAALTVFLLVTAVLVAAGVWSLVHRLLAYAAAALASLPR